jgi:hypothetical protein
MLEDGDLTTKDLDTKQNDLGQNSDVMATCSKLGWCETQEFVTGNLSRV